MSCGRKTYILEITGNDLIAGKFLHEPIDRILIIERLKMKINKMFLGFISVAVVTLLVACGGSATETLATATILSISYPTAEYTGLRTVIDNGSIKMEMGFPSTLPNELPRDVPIYYPGYPTNWNIQYLGQVTLFSIGIEAGSDQSSVLDWYGSNLSSNGWTIGPLDFNLGSESCGSEAPQVISATKDTRTLKVSVCASMCKTYCTTNITLFYTEIN